MSKTQTLDHSSNHKDPYEKRLPRISNTKSDSAITILSGLIVCLLNVLLAVRGFFNYYRKKWTLSKSMLIKLKFPTFLSIKNLTNHQKHILKTNLLEKGDPIQILNIIKKWKKKKHHFLMTVYKALVLVIQQVQLTLIINLLVFKIWMIVYFYHKILRPLQCNKYCFIASYH